MPAPTTDSSAAVSSTRATSRWLEARRWHKWAGLVALAWLGVLGATGFVMNHREDWNWIWQHGLPAAWFPANVVKTAESGLARHLQIDSRDPQRRVVAGAQGVFWSGDSGKTWTPAVADSGRPLIVNALEPAAEWSELWFGTHDGVWVSRDGGRTLARCALPGVKITAFAQGSAPGEFIGVADRSRVFRLQLAESGALVRWLPLGVPADSTTAPGTNLSRLTLDLHYGRGFLGSPWDEWLNDFAGLGLAFLCASGLLLWFLPWRWRRRRKAGAMLPAATARKNTLVWLMRTHAKWIGPLLVVPLAVLFVTGIYIGHFAALSPSFKAVALRPAMLPPTYAMRAWDDWIESVAAYPGQPQRLSLGTRTGLFTSDDDGRTWQRETSIEGGVLRLRRIGADLLAPNGMSGTAQRLAPDGWRPVAATGSHVAMASEVSPLGDGRLLWKHGTMLHLSDADSREIGSQSFQGPRATLVPFYTVASRLHTGAVFWKEWKWINDFFAVAGLVLLVTGVVRWVGWLRHRSRH